MEGVRGSIPLPPTINANEIKYLTIAKVSGAVVRNRDGVRGAQSRRQPRPSACPSTIRPSRTSLGPREKNRRTICNFFSKPESDFAALGRRGAFPLGHTISVIGGNSEASALREFASAIIERAELPVQKEHVEWLIGHDMIKAPLAH